MSLSEAIEVLTNFSNNDARSQEGHHPGMTRGEAQALARLLADARITIENLSRGAIRKEGRHQ